MKVGTRARYALHLMMQLAEDGSADHPVDITTIANRTGLSRRYLEQLAIDLKKAKLIKGERGRRGGYLAAKPPESIKVCDVVEATIGPISIVPCATDPSSCPKSATCRNRLIWALVNTQIRNALNEYSLADLKDPDQLLCILERTSQSPRKTCKS
jgi:Rrf2 family protein